MIFNKINTFISFIISHAFIIFIMILVTLLFFSVIIIVGIVICTAGKTADRGTVFAVSNDKPSEFFDTSATATSTSTTATDIATLSNVFAVRNDIKPSTTTTTITTNIATISTSATNNCSNTRNTHLNGRKSCGDRIYSGNNVPAGEAGKDQSGKIFVTSYKNGTVADNLSYNSTG